MAGDIDAGAPSAAPAVVLSQPTRSTTPIERIGAQRLLEHPWRRGCGTSWRWGAARSRPSRRQPGTRPAGAALVDAMLHALGRSRRCALQGVSSDQVLQMPITGRPSKRSAGSPWFFIQERW